MSFISRRLAACGIAAAVVTASGCGTQSASPAGPSGSDARRTATIVGQVSGASASSSSHSVQAFSNKGGIRVTVVGTSISATTDSNGHFTLSGVPTGDGSVALRFEGHGIDATLQISGLTPGQTLEVSVQLSGNQAHLGNEGDDDDQGDVEFSGHIDSLGSSSLMVDGRTVNVDSSTRIKDGDKDVTFATLTVGMVVEVEGAAQPGGSVLASKIKVESGDDGEGEDGDDGGGEDDD